MEENKVYKPKSPYVISIITLLISTVLILFVASIGYDSIAIKFDDSKTLEGLALIILIPLLIIAGIILFISSLGGIGCTIKCIHMKLNKISSIIFLVLHSIYLLSFLVIMILLFI